MARQQGECSPRAPSLSIRLDWIGCAALAQPGEGVEAVLDQVAHGLQLVQDAAAAEAGAAVPAASDRSVGWLGAAWWRPVRTASPLRHAARESSARAGDWFTRRLRSMRLAHVVLEPARRGGQLVLARPDLLAVRTAARPAWNASGCMATRKGHAEVGSSGGWSGSWRRPGLRARFAGPRHCIVEPVDRQRSPSTPSGVGTVGQDDGVPDRERLPHATQGVTGDVAASLDVHAAAPPKTEADADGACRGSHCAPELQAVRHDAGSGQRWPSGSRRHQQAGRQSLFFLLLRTVRRPAREQVGQRPDRAPGGRRHPAPVPADARDPDRCTITFELGGPGTDLLHDGGASDTRTRATQPIGSSVAVACSAMVSTMVRMSRMCTDSSSRQLQAFWNTAMDTIFGTTLRSVWGRAGCLDVVDQLLDRDSTDAMRHLHQV